MAATRFRTFSQRRLVWLLWFALLLPQAQAAATWHALSHTAVDTSGEGRHGLHQTDCDLCLTATAVIGGALPTRPQSFAHRDAQHAVPLAAFNQLWFASPTRAYRSRAPPLAQH